MKVKNCFITLACIISTMFLIFGIHVALVNASEPTFDDLVLKEVYALNEDFNVPAIQAEISGTKYETETKIVFPNGSVYKENSFILTDVGTYTLIYYFELNGKIYTNEKTFDVKERSEDLFSLKNAKVKFGQSDYYEGLTGAQIDGELGMEVVYNKVIDLSESTKEDLLLELVATAHTPKSSDFTRFIITLTDVHNSSNVVYLKAQCATNNSYYRTYMQAKTFEQRYVGVHNDQPNFGYDYGGTVLEHSFGSWRGEPKDNSDNTIKLYWDNKDLSVYTINYSGAKVEIADFNDESYQTKLWGGFTTGEVSLKIAIDGVTGSPRFVIKNINGCCFDGEYPEDKVAPTISVNLPEGSEFKAQVGKQFKIFDATVKDNFAIKNSTIKVYYNYEQGGYVESAIVDGAFIPSHSGEYTIVYSVSDTYGNLTTETVTVHVYYDLPALSVIFENNDTENVQKGEKFNVRAHTIEGGSGFYTKSFFLRDNSGEKEISETDNVVMATGEYFIVCKVSDYIDNFTETSYPLHVTEQTSLFLDAEIQLPKAFISGQKFFLPIVEAYDYRTNTPKAVKPTITAKISGTQIAVSEDGAIIPTATSDNETLTIKYNYSYGALSNEYSYEVPVIIAKDSDGLAIEKYFYSENFSVDPLLDSIRFSASESGAITTFVKPLQAKSFSLNFSVDQSITNVSYIDFELTDKVYKNISVFVRLYSNGKMSVNGGTRKSVYFTEKDSVKTFGLNYDNDNKAFSDLGGTVFGMVTNLNSGGGFNGFVSDEIYVTVRLGTVKNSVNLFISKLNGQIISRATRDTVPPQIFVNPVLGGSHNIGDTIIVYAAKAYDVLGFVKEFTMTVVNVETGEVLKSVDGITLQDVDASKDYRVTFTSFGQYQITFKAKDSNNRPSEASKNVLIADSEAPIIEIGKAVVSTGKVNESIQLPAMTVKDNYSSSDKIRKYIVVIYPNGFGKICKEYFTPTMQGRYYVRYMAIDENGQIAMKEYKVDVA